MHRRWRSLRTRHCICMLEYVMLSMAACSLAQADGDGGGEVKTHTVSVLDGPVSPSRNKRQQGPGLTSLVLLTASLSAWHAAYRAPPRGHGAGRYGPPRLGRRNRTT